MRRKRLQTLANYLVKADKRQKALKAAGKRWRKFDMNKWGNAKVLGLTEAKCGTSGCAVGWATTIPEFKRAGLHLASVVGSSTLCEPKFGRSGGFEAAERFFGLSYNEANYLFAPEYYRRKSSPISVSRRIKALLAGDDNWMAVE